MLYNYKLRLFWTIVCEGSFELVGRHDLANN